MDHRIQGTFDKETSLTRWVDFGEAKALTMKTTNATGRDRDLKVLVAAQGRDLEICSRCSNEQSTWLNLPNLGTDRLSEMTPRRLAF